jgi:hypothetical protein
MVRTRRAAALSALATEAVHAASRLTPVPEQRAPIKSLAAVPKRQLPEAAAVSTGNASLQMPINQQSIGRSDEVSTVPRNGFGNEDQQKDASLTPPTASLHLISLKSQSRGISAEAEPQSSPKVEQAVPDAEQCSSDTLIDGALFQTLVESVAPFLPDLEKVQLDNFILNSCARQLAEGSDIDPDKIANAIFSLDHDSPEWQQRLTKPVGISVKPEAVSTASGPDLRVLDVVMGRPSSALCCRRRNITHTFKFDLNSSKVLSEVDRCIRSVASSSMQYMTTDRQVPYLLLSPHGDVVVLSKSLLQACSCAIDTRTPELVVTAAPAASSHDIPLPTTAAPSASTATLHLVTKGNATTAPAAPFRTRAHPSCFNCRSKLGCMGGWERCNAQLAPWQPGVLHRHFVGGVRAKRDATCETGGCAHVWNCSGCPLVLQCGCLVGVCLLANG